MAIDKDTAFQQVGESQPLIGISAALPTPFREDGGIDHAAGIAHAQSCLRRGCDSVTIFGTTGEGASLDAGERREFHAKLVEAGVSPGNVTVGLCATAIGDACRQAEQAASIGAAAFLVPPPFYFKGIGEAAVFAWYDAFLSKVAGLGIPVVLYNIPQVTAVPVTPDVAMRLKQAHPDVVHGVKDSGGDLPTSLEFLEHRELAVFIGDERFLAKAVRKGAKGSISGLANLWPDRLSRILSTGEEDDTIVRIVDAVVKVPVVPAVKYLLAKQKCVGDWKNVRPPLLALSQRESQHLDALFEALQSGSL